MKGFALLDTPPFFYLSQVWRIFAHVLVISAFDEGGWIVNICVHACMDMDMLTRT